MFFAKVYRRREPRNPEPHMLDYLSTRIPGLVPKPYCIVRYRWDRGIPYMVVLGDEPGRVAAETYVEAARLSVQEEEPRPLPLLGGLIGEAVAWMHRALLNCRDEWCAPEDASAKDLERWARRMIHRASLLGELLPKDLGLKASQILPSMASRLLRRAEVPRAKSMVHGDLHLGQIKVNGSRVVITDFEGEPYRSPALVGEKETPERDLACLARSIDYAAHLGSGRLEQEALLNPPPVLWEWIQRSFKAILEAYVAAGGSRPSPGLLAFWLAERASYEAIYELKAGTGLHPIPLAAIARMWEGRDPLLEMLGEQG